MFVGENNTNTFLKCPYAVWGHSFSKPNYLYFASLLQPSRQRFMEWLEYRSYSSFSSNWIIHVSYPKLFRHPPKTDQYSQRPIVSAFCSFTLSRRRLHAQSVFPNFMVIKERASERPASVVVAQTAAKAWRLIGRVFVEELSWCRAGVIKRPFLAGRI